MKGSLTEAVTRLGAVSEDPVIANEIASKMATSKIDAMQQQQDKCDANVAEVLKLVLTLKGDVTVLK